MLYLLHTKNLFTFANMETHIIKSVFVGVPRGRVEGREGPIGAEEKAKGGRKGAEGGPSGARSTRGPRGGRGWAEGVPIEGPIVGPRARIFRIIEP